MTDKDIRRAVGSGRLVTLGDDPMSCICEDLFGSLVVVSRCEDVPVRMATPADKRRARVTR